jgi:uncharacterized protein
MTRHIYLQYSRRYFILVNMKKLTIITGASSGMGTEFARQLSAYSQTDEIWLLARRKDRLETLAAKLCIPDRPLPRVVPVDISGRQGISKFADLLEEEKNADKELGGFRISMLVNNAGFGTYGTFTQTDLDRQLDMIDLNCTTLTGICGKALPFMDRGSTIINVASLASFLPLGNFAVYGATKSYVLSFTLALAAETSGKGIKVCALCPGPVSTEFADVASNGARKTVLHGLPADKVVAHCLKQADRGKHTAIMALKWKFKAFASRFVGKYTGAYITYKFCRRPANPVS